MISAISCFSSSQPATSLKRTRILPSNFALDFENSNAFALAPFAPFIRFSIQTANTANKINGIMDATVSKKILDASASTIVNFVESFPRFLITCPISSEVDGIVAVNVTFCLSFS